MRDAQQQLPLARPSATSLLPAVCHQCGHRWDVRFEVPLPLREFSRQLKAIVCAGCGARSNEIGLETTSNLRATLEGTVP